ncbi:hypothetical protein DXG01_006315 [Tephrocybe rancida]|nr:hypothetical protein DXG01_006315 [Tephrocybe rancida]
MIGVNIIASPQLFLDTYNSGNDIAAHTWTHPYMTTLSNLQILAQFGWTSELIRNSTGGRLPRYWRPPYGDSDMRVRSIAKEVFGLETVIWNQDTEDWSLTAVNGTNLETIHNSMVQWLAAPKTTGIITLEHEISNLSVSAYMDAFPLIGPAGWKTASLAAIIGDSVYQNSDDSDSPVTAHGILTGDTTGPTALASPVVAGQTISARPPSAATKAAQSSQTSNAASALARRDLPMGLPYALLSLCAPALVAALSLLA